MVLVHVVDRLHAGTHQVPRYVTKTFLCIDQDHADRFIDEHLHRQIPKTLGNDVYPQYFTQPIQPVNGNTAMQRSVSQSESLTLRVPIGARRVWSDTL